VLDNIGEERLNFGWDDFGDADGGGDDDDDDDGDVGHADVGES